MNKAFLGKMKSIDKHAQYTLVWGESKFQGDFSLVAEADTKFEHVDINLTVDFSLSPFRNMNAIIILADKNDPVVIYLNVTERLMDKKNLQCIIRVFKRAYYGGLKGITGMVLPDLKINISRAYGNVLLDSRNGTMVSWDSFNFRDRTELAGIIENRFTRRQCVCIERKFFADRDGIEKGVNGERVPIDQRGVAKNHLYSMM